MSQIRHTTKELNFDNTLPSSNAIFKKKKMKDIFITLSSLFILLSGCVGHACKDDCIANGLDENCCPKIDSTIKPLDKPSIKRINIFMETSGSMAGYMPNSEPATDFQKIIPNILSNLHTGFPNEVNFYSIFNSNIAFAQLETNVARDYILHGKFSWSGSTYLPTMLDSIITGYLKDDAVNIFISDCIYSPEKKDLKETELASTDIREKITPHINSFSTTAFSFYSEFRSKNYPSKRSPYYLIVQGKPENNREVENLLIKSLNQNSQSFDEVNFGLKYDRPYYSVLPYTGITANFIANPCESFQNAFVSIQGISLAQQSDSMKFWVGLNLKDFPSYVTALTYLDSNLDLTMEKGIAKIISITNKPPKELVKDDKPIADKSTHFILIKISQLDDCVTSLHLALKYSRPKWIASLNELSNEYNRDKTFGLERIISGFEQAYYPDGNAYFLTSLNISLIKQ